MSTQDTQGQDNNPQNVSQPDANQVAPSDNKPEDTTPPADTQPKETDAQAVEDDVILPDDGDDGTPSGGDQTQQTSTEDGSAQPEGTQQGTDDNKPDDSSNPQDATAGQDDQKKQNEEGYWKRKAQEKDQVIDDLTQVLQQNYIDQGKDDSDKRVRTLEANDYVRNIRESRSQLVADNQRVSNEIPVFNPSSADYLGQEAVQGIMARYARDNVITQPIQRANGEVSNEIIGYRQPLFEYMNEQAEIIGKARKAGKVEGQETGRAQGQKDVKRMQSKAEVPGGATPAPQKSEDNDDFLKGFNSVT